jgi:Zn-dependent protease with chaperone function
MKRLNPFAFPPETNARFTLLVSGAVTIVTSISLVVWAKLNTLGAPNFQVDPNWIQSVDSGALYLYACGAPLVVIFMSGGLLAVAYWFYRHHPERILQKAKLKPLDVERDRNFVAALQELAQRAEIEMPEINMGPARAQDGQAFGFRSRLMLRLGTGLKAMRLNPDFLPGFQAVVLHEFAHIKNDDVQRAYFAEAIWRSLLFFISFLTIIFAVITVSNYLDPRIMPSQSFLSLLFGLAVGIVSGTFIAIELGLIVGVAHFVRRGTLRIRETYADWRAAQWGAMDGLTQILSAAKGEKQMFWKQLRSAHPRPEDRLEALCDPYQLFRLTYDVPLANGFLFGFAFSGMGQLFGLAWILILNPPNAFLALFGTFSLAIVCVAALVTLLWLLANTLGLQIQREATGDLDRKIGGVLPYLRLFPLAILFHLGFEAGVLLMPYEQIQVDVLSRGLYAVLALPLWIFGISVMTWLWMSAIRFFARRWLGSHSGAQLPAGKVRALNIIAMLTLPVLYIPFVMTRGWPAVGTDMLLPAFLVMMLIVVLFSLFCLAGWMIISGFCAAPKCYKCGTTHTSRQTVGQVCRTCGTKMAAWLYLP